MKKQLFMAGVIAITLLFSGCSGGDDSPTPVQNVDTSQLLGKWIIYKAIHGEGTEPILYESNGTCGREILEFKSNGEVTEKSYIDEDCMNGGMGTYSWWILDNGAIAFGAINSYHHTVTVNGDELVLDAREEVDYIKYYHRAN